MKNKTLTTAPPLDALYCELLTAAEAGRIPSCLDLCLRGNAKAIKDIPLRYRLIALGFVRGLSPEEVNRRLLENGCAQLYARSYWEASVIYALRSGLSYAEWKTLDSECASLREEIVKNPLSFSSRTISLMDVRRYVEDNSLREADIASTRQLTKAMEKKLTGVSPEKAAFREFLLSNLTSFSTVREKVRYYFCKYLLYYLTAKAEDCLAFLKKKDCSRVHDSDVLSDAYPDCFLFFKVQTKLRRRRHTPAEAREIIESGALSLGWTYRLFSLYYCNYPDHDWMQVLMEREIEPEFLSPSEQKSLADAVRRESPGAALLSDEEAFAWYKDERVRLENETDYSDLSYQAGREGENFLRKILRGTLDLDRITFLAFLTFFGRNAKVPPQHRICRERLDDILQESGFPILDPVRPFDCFLCGFLESEDPDEYLMEEAEKLALSGTNFHLYKSRLMAEGIEQKWRKLTQSANHPKA